MATRYVLIRANNPTQAKKFAKQIKKLSTMEYSPERISSVKLDKKSGLAGGVKGYKVGLTRMKVERYKRGSKKYLLKPKYNKRYA